MSRRRFPLGLFGVQNEKTGKRIGFRAARRLVHEPLEPRLVLSGTPLDDPALDGGLGDWEGTGASGEVLLATSATADPSSTSTALERFASAEELKQFLVEDALERWQDLFGQPAYWYCWGAADGLKVALAVAAGAENTYSETNVQVGGIDEPDLVETDGRLVYSLSQHELTIVEVGDAAELPVVARVAISGYPRGMLLSGNRLTVLGSDWASQSQSIVTVFDVSDPASPTVLEETRIEGDYADARAIGGQVILVLRDDFYLPPPLVVGEPWPEPLPIDDPVFSLSSSDAVAAGAADLSAAVPGDALLRPDPYQRTYETKEEYLARIETQVLDLVMPAVASFNGSGELVESGWLLEPTDIYRPRSDEDIVLASIAVFDTADDTPGPVDTVAVASTGATEIYLSSAGLFVLSSRQDWWGDFGSQTSILKFDVSDESGQVDLSATGSVPGRLLDQFSFDVEGGSLRVATTSGAWTDAENSLFVLEQAGQTFQQVGQLTGIAPGEQIYAARFLGDRAYLVTFQRVDPLFTVDLSNPAEPQLAGELEIPGFSNYLQSIGEGYLLGLGRDVDPETGIFGDPQISLFDVSDMASPQRVDQVVLPVGFAGGLNLFEDHHQVAYFPEYGVLTVVAPAAAESCWNALWVFRIDPSATGTEGDRAIVHLATIEHDSNVSRAVRLGQRLVVVSDEMVTVHDLLSPQATLASVYAGTTWLGEVAYTEVDDLAPSQGDRLFCLEASTTGLLTFDALFERNAESDATLTLYDAQMQELAVSASNYPWAQARLDWQAQAGERFYLKVSGTVDQADLRIVNAVSLSGEFPDSVLTVTSPTPDCAIQYEIYWHPTGGNPWEDGIKTQAFTRRQSFDVAGVHYDLAMNNPSVVMEGFGWSTLVVDISKITMSEEERGDIIVDLSDGSGTISCTGPVFGWNADGQPIPFEMSVSGFYEITVNHGDVAKLRGSEGSDTFTSQPGSAVMQTPNGAAIVNGFREVHAYSSPGNADVAVFYDTPGDDFFVATPEYAKIYGEDYFARAKGFRYTHAYSTSGGIDEAKLKDSPGNDCFIATPEFARLRGGNYNNRAKFFRYVHAYASGGVDEARFVDSPGADAFVATAQYAKLQGAGFANRAKFFDKVDLRAGNGADTAVLRDAVLTAPGSGPSEQDSLLAAAWLYGLERCELRGNATDERPDAQVVDQLLAYWVR